MLHAKTTEMELKHKQQESQINKLSNDVDIYPCRLGAAVAIAIVVTALAVVYETQFVTICHVSNVRAHPI